jgi:hypothetical protein
VKKLAVYGILLALACAGGVMYGAGSLGVFRPAKVTVFRLDRFGAAGGSGSTFRGYPVVSESEVADPAEAAKLCEMFTGESAFGTELIDSAYRLGLRLERGGKSLDVLLGLPSAAVVVFEDEEAPMRRSLDKASLDDVMKILGAHVPSAAKPPASAPPSAPDAAPAPPKAPAPAGTPNG